MIQDVRKQYISDTGKLRREMSDKNYFRNED